MKIERKMFHRRAAKGTEIIHLFSLSRIFFGTKKMVMPFGQGLINANNVCEVLGLFLCDLCTSSEASGEA